ncbi:MAG: type II toxin-antitoxin system Phd/YefM family antitoxin [Rhizomicrobium sp.]
MRQLKNHLSAHVRRARRGETAAVTDRGQVAAEFVPPHRDQGAASGPERLARTGELRLAPPANRQKQAVLLREPAPILTQHSIQELLGAERGER